MSDAESGEETKQDLLTKLKSRRDKVLRFDVYDDSGPYTWFVAYKGNFGWSACRGNGDWEDAPDEDEVEWAIDEYDEVQLVDRSDLPKEVSI